MKPRFIGTFTWYYGLVTIPRGMSYIVSSIMYPLAFLFLIFIFTQGRFIEVAAIGGFIAIVASNAIYSSSDAAFQRIQLRFQDLLVATNISFYDYMFAMSLSYLANSLPGIAVYAVIGTLLHIFTISRALAFTGVLLMVMLAASSIAFMIAGFIKHIRNVWGIASIVSLVLTVIPPTFYPYTLIPKAALYALMISPVTPAAMLAQGIFGISKFQPYAILVLVVETVVYFAIAIKLNKWRET
ncbi:MAG: ABC transporter permease [Candidatus Micrarchaeaceae archaeon]